MTTRHHQAFTLVEILMVISVIAILSAMLSPMYGIVKRSVMKSRTQFVLKKVDTALRLFKTDWSVFPYQAAYPDLAGGGALANDLYYRVGTDISDDDARNVRLDMKAAAAQFAYRWSGGANMSINSVSESAQPSALTYRIADSALNFSENVAPLYGTNQRIGTVGLLNRMAQEQVRLAFLAGNVEARGPFIRQGATAPAANKTGTRIIAAGTAASRNRPGWAQDYLAGDIEKRLVQGTAILDAWKRPLVYIGQNIPGVRGSGAGICGAGLPFFDARLFGLGPIGFDPTTGPGPGLISGGRSLLLYGGRVRLSLSDAGDRQPTPADAIYFPDAGRLIHSDVRYYAAPGYETEFELWSAGPDGRFAYMRDERMNEDNIAVTPFTKGIK